MSAGIRLTAPVRRALLAGILGAASTAGAGVLVWAETVHARSSRRRVGDAGTDAASEAVVVLGFRNRGRRINAVNRYRVRAALRSFDDGVAERVLIASGGAVGGDIPEAVLLAHEARRRGYTGPLHVEAASRTTWQNVENAIPLLSGWESIKIVSNSLHAEVAREYLRRQRPDLADRLRPAGEHRFGELLLVKPFAAVIGLRFLSRLERTAAD